MGVRIASLSLGKQLALSRSLLGGLRPAPGRVFVPGWGRAGTLPPL